MSRPLAASLSAVAAAALTLTAVAPADASACTTFRVRSVDIPYGAVAQRIPGKDGAAPTLAYEQTQWATVHDLTNRLLYFRTYGGLAIRKVDLGKLDWTGKAIRHIPMPTAMEAENVTALAR